MSEDDQKPVFVQSVFAGVLGAFAAWVGFLLLIFSFPDPQSGIAVFISPVVAAPVGIGLGIAYAAYHQETLDQKLGLLLFAAFCVGPPLMWVGGELMQMFGYW
jgi:hypothetical protein